MELPPNWELREHKDYPTLIVYYNVKTNESTWVRPIPYPGNATQDWPPFVYLHQIIVYFGDQHKLTKEAAKEKINNAYKKLVENEMRFEDVAKSDSDSYKNDKGIRGWIKKNSTNEIFESVAWELNVGEMSKPFECEESFVILLRRG